MNLLRRDSVKGSTKDVEHMMSIEELTLAWKVAEGFWKARNSMSNTSAGMQINPNTQLHQWAFILQAGV